MKRLLYILLLLCAVGAVEEGYAQRRSKNNLTPVDIKAKRTRPVPVGDSTGYAMVGDVILYHNGAVITCDSVVRYSERRMSCFGKVIVKKEDTYIYGNRVDYNRDKGEARIYSPLIKVRNKDATLYTYNLVFNTAKNIGRFYGGATFSNGVNTLEAERGYFYADMDEIVGVENVEMENETYRMRSDSVSYNSESEIAKYFTRSTTWKNDGEIITSDRGEYFNKEQRYIFRGSAYVMGENQEMWADTIDYHEQMQFIELRHMGQIRDDEHKSVIFGHYGNYNDATGDTFLTLDPAYLSFGDADGDGVNDTVYMRSDSMYLYLVDSLGYCTLTRPDSAALAAELAKKAQDVIDRMRADSTAIANAKRDIFKADSVMKATIEARESLLDSLVKVRTELALKEKNDSLEGVERSVVALVDSLRRVNPGLDSLTRAKTDSLILVRRNLIDSLGRPRVDTVPVKTQRDRIMLGLHRVKVYREDFQGICDSMLMFSADSTAQLHKNSVMWNEMNQVVSERADVYTRGQKPYRVLFSEGKPLMSAEIDTMHYNQIAGKTIESHFEDGVMYRTDVVGNAQTYYYMVDDSDGAITGYLVAESADMSFYIEDNTVIGIMYRGNPVYTIYPMDKIPASQPQRMDNFVWYIEDKPTKEQIMGGWVVNPSERERYEGLQPPQFPITYSILRHRDALVSGGRWADRKDDISQMAKDFIKRVQNKRR